MLRTKSLIALILLCGASLLLLLPTRARSGQDAANLPKELTWKLAELNKAPLRVVATQYDANLRIVLWTLELTRDLDVVEDALYWAPAYRFEKRPLIRFEFQNANGIILKTIDPKYFGEYVNKKGKRFGALLAIPDEALPATKIVEATIR